MIVYSCLLINMAHDVDVEILQIKQKIELFNQRFMERFCKVAEYHDYKKMECLIYDEYIKIWRSFMIN